VGGSPPGLAVFFLQARGGGLVMVILSVWGGSCMGADEATGGGGIEFPWSIWFTPCCVGVAAEVGATV
jgi:hypothetical protein